MHERSCNGGRQRVARPARLIVGLAALATTGLVSSACAAGSNGPTGARGSSDADSLMAGLANLELLQANADVQVEEATAACMRREGFEYVPTTSSSVARLAAFDDHDFRTRYGYGISTQSSGSSAATGSGPLGPDGDPNSRILADLDPAATRAYLDAMYGLTQAAVSSGCFNVSRHELGGPFDAFMESHGTELVTMWGNLEADPELSDARREWAECMRGEGFDITGPEDLQLEISTRLAALGPSDRSGLAALQAHERSGSLADQRCFDRELAEVTNRLIAVQRSRLAASGSTLFEDLADLTAADDSEEPPAVS